MGVPNPQPAGYGSPGGGANYPCSNASASWTFVNTGPQLLTDANNITLAVMPVISGTVAVNDGFGDIFTAYAIPTQLTGVSHVHTTVGSTQSPNQPAGVFSLQFVNAAGAIIGSEVFGQGSANNVHAGSNFVSIPANTRYWALFHTTQIPGGDTVNGTIDTQIDLWCGGESPNSPNAPCTTDPALLALVQEIWNELQFILKALPSPTTSYTEAAAHGNLTGNGQVAVSSSAIAIKVAITTDNGSLRVDVGNPSYLFNRGYIVALTSEGAAHQLPRLVYNPQIFQLPPVTANIGYSLGQGIVASITELVRGP